MDKANLQFSAGPRDAAAPALEEAQLICFAARVGMSVLEISHRSKRSPNPRGAKPTYARS